MEFVFVYLIIELEKELVFSICVRDVNFLKGFVCIGIIFYFINFDLVELWFYWKYFYGK